MRFLCTLAISVSVTVGINAAEGAGVVLMELADPEGGPFWSQAYTVSEDGRMVVGAFLQYAPFPVMWTTPECVALHPSHPGPDLAYPTVREAIAAAKEEETHAG